MSISGLVANGHIYQKFDEDKHEGMRLGRNMWLDSRSLAYMVENNVAEMGKPFESKRWERKIPILDQGNLGSCTGNAGTGALGTEPFFPAVGQKALGGANTATELEKFAVALYSDATKEDQFPGTYPPTDEGSSGLGICRVLKNRGVVSGYRFARSPYGLLRLLQSGPVIQGMPWYKAFFEPDAGGFIDANANWKSSGLAGGHEIEAVGVELDTKDAFNSVIIYANSWSETWADKGYFRMRLRTYEELSSVDLKQFVI